MCPVCGVPHESGDRFCGECGAALEVAAALTSLPEKTLHEERRLVSVLFADLVGFTPLAEQRDPEDVRELLTRYFASAQAIVARHGGVVEKFIGDAVMAVWGTPTATENDADRAVRAGPELLAAIDGLADDVGVPRLKARARVATGEAAVDFVTEGQGMVVGDVVNTAARVQAAGKGPIVPVDTATYRAARGAIAFEDAGSFELKGKAELVPLFCATQVTARTRGGLRAAGLEAPFVGRSREMRLMKEVLHGATKDERAHLVSVTGVAGVGKFRPRRRGGSVRAGGPPACDRIPLGHGGYPLWTCGSGNHSFACWRGASRRRQRHYDNDRERLDRPWARPRGTPSFHRLAGHRHRTQRADLSVVRRLRGGLAPPKRGHIRERRRTVIEGA